MLNNMRNTPAEKSSWFLCFQAKRWKDTLDERQLDAANSFLCRKESEKNTDDQMHMLHQVSDDMYTLNSVEFSQSCKQKEL